MATDLKLDILAIAAHPDDVELSCAGTLMKMASQGKKIGILDLTRGELGTRGTPEIRAQEAAASSKIMGLDVRMNLGYKDGFFQNDETHQRGIIEVIRLLRPDVVLVNAPYDRHPDHGKGSTLAHDAAFLAGLRRIETSYQGIAQEAWRPAKVWRYIQDQLIMPDFIVDITPFMERKLDAIRAFSSQFFDPSSDEPATYISSQDFFEFVKARAREYGHLIGGTFGEGFVAEKPLRVEDLTAHL